MRQILLTIIFSLALPALAQVPQESTAFSRTTLRSARVGLSYNVQTAHPFSDTSSSGPSFFSVYEFNLNPRFALGIDLEYRQFSGDRSAGQLGYGLLLKHYLQPLGSFRPYLEYGLLMNVTRRKGSEGAGTSHDTRLAVGGDFELFENQLFTDLSYHYSRLSYFDQPTINLDYVQLAVGARFGWGPSF